MNGCLETCAMTSAMVAMVAGAGCAGSADMELGLSAPRPLPAAAVAGETYVGASTQAIVDVAHTPVERQSIGNCWIYATTGWVESMHLRATGEGIDLSESYWTYMHWYIQLTTTTRGLPRELSTGGNIDLLPEIVERFGWMYENEFIPTDQDGERAVSQKRALDRVNKALSEKGELATSESRQDTARVRSLLDEAWNLSKPMRRQLDAVFGADMGRDFSYGADALDTNIRQGHDLEVAYTTGPGTEAVHRTLWDAIGDWRTVSYSRWSARQSLQRMQRALHQAEPVVVSWLVDFNALESDKESDLYGTFNLQTLQNSGQPGNQGGHMTVLEDYQARVQQRVERMLSEVTLQHDVPPDAFILVANEDAESWHLDENQFLNVVMKGTGDADLYVQTGAAPSPQRYACRPYRAGSYEVCDVVGPADVYIAIGGYSDAVVELDISIKSVTEEERLLAAGQSLDPENPEDAALLEAALGDATVFEFLRVKNSWGAIRPDLPMVDTTDKGYHDLYFDYLEGPVARVASCKKGFQDSDCLRTTTPLARFLLPPGY